ncbi:Uu.00g106160.m01.CDS01 [Anthostomella pinea]|uniref:Uu.00g106160.m01.CDS01 n=1 Tax=Anthostomella pinea TaxID=933095 RepID=A0AAI8YFV2_9PEZI|nr:Uu.00g106160.m01.CDS01 [Anthostomella pinea]
MTTVTHANGSQPSSQATFTCFPQLPPELRDLIWEAALPIWSISLNIESRHHRYVHICQRIGRGRLAISQACHGARCAGLETLAKMEKYYSAHHRKELGPTDIDYSRLISCNTGFAGLAIKPEASELQHMFLCLRPGEAKQMRAPQVTVLAANLLAATPSLRSICVVRIPSRHLRNEEVIGGFIMDYIRVIKEGYKYYNPKRHV